MSSDDYQLNSSSKLLHDIEANSESGRDIDAMVASGDLFITLATKLDELTHTADLKSVVADDIERVVATMLYLQRHYKVMRKPADYRQ